MIVHSCKRPYYNYKCEHNIPELKYPWSTPKDPPKCLWSITEVSLNYHRSIIEVNLKCPWSVHEVSLKCPWSTPGVSHCPWSITEVSLECPRSIYEVSLKYLSIPEVSLKYPRSISEMHLKHPWSIPEVLLGVNAWSNRRFCVWSIYL